jgi:hypothetical protein
MIFGEVMKTRYAPSSHISRRRSEFPPRFQVVFFVSFSAGTAGWRATLMVHREIQERVQRAAAGEEGERQKKEPARYS